MIRNSAKLAILMVFGTAAAFGLSLYASGVVWGQETEKTRSPKAASETLPTLVLTAGQHYQIFMPDGRPYFGDRKLVLIQKVFANGWVEAKTAENQICWLNLNHAMQIYLVDDVHK